MCKNIIKQEEDYPKFHLVYNSPLLESGVRGHSSVCFPLNWSFVSPPSTLSPLSKSNWERFPPPVKYRPPIFVHVDLKGNVGEERKGEKIYALSLANSQTKQVKPRWGWKEEASVSVSPYPKLKNSLFFWSHQCDWKQECNPHCCL